MNMTRKRTKRFILLVLLSIPMLGIGQPESRYAIDELEPQNSCTINGRYVKKGDTVKGNDMVCLLATFKSMQLHNVGTLDHIIEIKGEEYTNFSNTVSNLIESTHKTLSFSKAIHKSQSTKGIYESQFIEGITDTVRFGKCKRLALVIGINEYDKDALKLKSPVKDADYVLNKLSHLGFDILPLCDATQKTINKRLTDFWKQANVVGDNGDNPPPYDMLLIYFSGHGMRIGGEDYLLPKDTRISKKKIRKKYLSVKKLLEQFRKNTSMGPTFIILYDACRIEYPHEKTDPTNVRRDIQLLPNEAVFYSCQAGAAAYEGALPDMISPFTKILVPNIGTTNQTILTEFNNIRSLCKESSLYPSLIISKGAATTGNGIAIRSFINPTK